MQKKKNTRCLCDPWRLRRDLAVTSAGSWRCHQVMQRCRGDLYGVVEVMPGRVAIQQSCCRYCGAPVTPRSCGVIIGIMVPPRPCGGCCRIAVASVTLWRLPQHSAVPMSVRWNDKFLSYRLTRFEILNHGHLTKSTTRSVIQKLTN